MVSIAAGNIALFGTLNSMIPNLPEVAYNKSIGGPGGIFKHVESNLRGLGKSFVVNIYDEISNEWLWLVVMR